MPTAAGDNTPSLLANDALSDDSASAGTSGGGGGGSRFARSATTSIWTSKLVTPFGTSKPTVLASDVVPGSIGDAYGSQRKQWPLVALPLHSLVLKNGCGAPSQSVDGVTFLVASKGNNTTPPDGLRRNVGGTSAMFDIVFW